MMAVALPVTPQKQSRGCGYYLGVVVAGVFVLGALGYFVGQVSIMNKPAPSPEEQAAKQKEQAALMVAATGAKHLRSSMRNPDAFKLTKALLMKSGAVCYEFRS